MVGEGVSTGIGYIKHWGHLIMPRLYRIVYGNRTHDSIIGKLGCTGICVKEAMYEAI